MIRPDFLSGACYMLRALFVAYLVGWLLLALLDWPPREAAQTRRRLEGRLRQCRQARGELVRLASGRSSTARAIRYTDALKSYDGLTDFEHQVVDHAAACGSCAGFSLTAAGSSMLEREASAERLRSNADHVRTATRGRRQRFGDGPNGGNLADRRFRPMYEWPTARSWGLDSAG